MTSNLRRGRHSVSALLVLMVFVSKYRKKVFDEDGLKTLENAFSGVAKQMNFQIIEFNGESDHVHLLVEYPPKLSISPIVNHLKGVSSRLYRQKHLSPSEKHLWSPSSACCFCWRRSY